MEHVSGTFDIEDKSGAMATVEASGYYCSEEETNAGWWEQVQWKVIEAEEGFDLKFIDTTEIELKLENFL